MASEGDTALPAVVDALLGRVRLDVDAVRGPVLDRIARARPAYRAADREHDRGRRTADATGRRDPEGGRHGYDGATRRPRGRTAPARHGGVEPTRTRSRARSTRSPRWQWAPGSMRIWRPRGGSSWRFRHTRRTSRRSSPSRRAAIGRTRCSLTPCCFNSRRAGRGRARRRRRGGGGGGGGGRGRGGANAAAIEAARTAARAGNRGRMEWPGRGRASCARSGPTEAAGYRDRIQGLTASPTPEIREAAAYAASRAQGRHAARDGSGRRWRCAIGRRRGAGLERSLRRTGGETRALGRRCRRRPDAVHASGVRHLPLDRSG